MRVSLQKLMPQHLMSRAVGWVAATEFKPIKTRFIHWAINHYGINLAEAENSDPDSYASFNQFFTRALKPGIRPISGEFCSPADGEVSQLGAIEDGKLLQAKGIDYSLAQLLAKTDVSAYNNGSFATIYLSPKDYHRVHSPVSGELIAARYVPGKLFSVNQETANEVPGLFAVNERLVMEFTTEHGDVSVVMVGAMIVAGIQPVWRDCPYPARLSDQTLEASLSIQAGDELGRFLMGSTAIVVSQKPLDFCHRPEDLVQMGQSLVTP